MPVGIACAILLAFLLASSANATKCLSAKTIFELSNDFPVVLKGKIASKVPKKKAKDSFDVTIDVVKYLHGDLKIKTLKAVEVEFQPMPPSRYRVGGEYTFPVEKKPGKPGYQVHFEPAGCPDVPSE